MRSPSPMLTPADYDSLKDQLSSENPNIDLVTSIISRIITLNLINLELSISDKGMDLFVKLLTDNLSIEQIIIESTCLSTKNRDNVVFEILFSIMEKRTRPLKLLKIGNIETKDLPYSLNSSLCRDEQVRNTEQKLLSLFKKSPIKELALDRLGMNMGRVLGAISSNDSLESLKLNQILISLTPPKNQEYIPEAESLDLLRALYNNTSLTHVEITNAVPDIKYRLYDLSIAKFNTKLAGIHNNEINLMIIRNTLPKILCQDIGIANDLLALILHYLLPPQLWIQRDTILDQKQEFIKELISETSNSQKVENYVKNITELKFETSDLKVSKQGFDNLVNAICKYQQINAFYFNHFNIFYQGINWGLPKTYWGTTALIYYMFEKNPRPLKYLDLSHVNWNWRSDINPKVSLKELLMAVNRPIETLILTDHKTNANHSFYGCISDYQTPLINILHFITHINISNSGIFARIFLEEVSKCSSLLTLIMNDSLVTLTGVISYKSAPIDTVDALIEILTKNTSLTFIEFKKALILSSIVDFIGTGKPKPEAQAALDIFNNELEQKQDKIQEITIRNKSFVDRDKIWDLAFHLFYTEINLARPLCHLILNYYDELPAPAQPHYYKMATQIPAYQTLLTQQRKIAPEDYKILISQLETTRSDLKVMEPLFNKVTAIDFSDENLHISCSGVENLIKLLRHKKITSFIMDSAHLYYIQKNQTTLITLTLLTLALSDHPRRLKILDISNINWGDPLFKFGDLDVLLKHIKSPIKFFRLANPKFPASFNISEFHGLILEFIKRDLVEHFDLINFGIDLIDLLEAMKLCKKLKFISIDGNEIGRASFSQALNILEQNTSLRKINFKKAGKETSEITPQLNKFNFNLRDQQHELENICQRNYITANKGEICNRIFETLSKLPKGFPLPLYHLVLSFYGITEVSFKPIPLSASTNLSVFEESRQASNKKRLNQPSETSLIAKR